MAGAPVAAYRFGDFLLNVERASLQRNGADIELRPKAFDVLRHLVERAGRLVTKDELVSAIWPDVTVSDDSLAQCVSEIRKTLDDDEQRYIKTMPRRGYVFIASVEELKGSLAAGSDNHPTRRGLFTKPRFHVASFVVGALVPTLLLAAWLGAANALLRVDEVQSLRTPIFEGNKTILGQTIAYPSGTPFLRADMILATPGDEFGWHTHRGPVLGYVLEGEVTIDYGSKGVHVLRTGEAALEAVEWPHRFSNRGAAPARVLAIYLGSEGAEFSTPVDVPK